MIFFDFKICLYKNSYCNTNHFNTLATNNNLDINHKPT